MIPTPDIPLSKHLVFLEDILLISMNTKTIEKFHIIGLAIRTTNQNGQSAHDIPKLWETFFTENIRDQIPNKIDTSIYCVYTAYEKDHTTPYTTILGCKVENLSQIPESMVAITVEQAAYTKYVAEGNLAEGIVYNQWLKIWEADLPRAFTTDFEVYGKKAENPEQAEVEIFIAIN